MSALKGQSREEEEIYRLGGDEFIQIVKNIPDEEELSSIAKRYQTLIDSVSSHLLKDAPIQPARKKRTPVRRHVNLSIGIAPYIPNENADELITEADGAMYQSKISPEALAVIVHTDVRGARHYTQLKA